MEKCASVLAFLSRRGIEAEGNPDMYVREYLSFKINDARELRDRAQTKAVLGGRRVFIVIAPSMTTDAQNALLKTLEEPPADALFIFIVASPQTMLPTLRSRVQFLRVDEGAKGEARVDVVQFLKAGLEKRIDMLKPLYQHDDDERDIRGAVAFLQALEREFAAHTPSSRPGIEAIYLARKYLMDKGALLKPLLEQVALLSPKM
jgi:DNA polymerase III delta prime subunit